MISKWKLFILNLDYNYLAWEDVFEEIDFLDDVVDIPNGIRSFPLKEQSLMSPIDVLCCDKSCCWLPNLDGDNKIDFLLLPWLPLGVLYSLFEVIEPLSRDPELRLILLLDKTGVFMTAKAQTSNASRAPSNPHRLSTSSVE